MRAQAPGQPLTALAEVGVYARATGPSAAFGQPAPADCGPLCYDAGSGTKWWGVVGSAVDVDALFRPMEAFLRWALGFEGF
jgi:hypothetical protein